MPWMGSHEWYTLERWPEEGNAAEQGRIGVQEPGKEKGLGASVVFQGRVKLKEQATNCPLGWFNWKPHIRHS